jgi:hypothetical protein
METTLLVRGLASCCGRGLQRGLGVVVELQSMELSMTMQHCADDDGESCLIPLIITPADDGEGDDDDDDDELGDDS